MQEMSLIDQNIILTLNFFQGKYKKKYCFPSQKKILSILSEVYHINICLRTLNYHLARLESNHYIYRLRRISQNPTGCLTFNSTLYSLAKKAYFFLSQLFNHLKDGYYSIKGFLRRKYISSQKELLNDQRFLSPDENVRRLRELRTKL